MEITNKTLNISKERNIVRLKKETCFSEKEKLLLKLSMLKKDY